MMMGSQLLWSGEQVPGRKEVGISSSHASSCFLFASSAHSLMLCRREADASGAQLLVAAFVLASHTHPTERRIKFWLEGLRDTQLELRGQVKLHLWSRVCVPCFPGLHAELKTTGYGVST